VLAKVREIITSLPGVLRMEFLDTEFHEILYELEKQAEANGACGGIMPFTNSGVWEAFKREVQFVIVAEESTVLIGAGNGLVYISDERGQIVGEWVNPARAEKLKERKDVYFLGDDFVMYPEVQMVGEPFFVLPPVDFPYLDDVPEVTDLASGSISTLADDYVRRRWGYFESKHWTHLVGFNIR